MNEGNIEIVNHSYNHLRMAEDEIIATNIRRLKHEILGAQKWLERVYGKKQIVFVCPGNQMCNEGYKILKKYNFI